MAGKIEVVLTPIENAIDAIIAKTGELKDMTAKVAGGTTANPVDANPLSMCLNGIIDAAVNGGTKLYIEAFMGKDFLEENPSEKFVHLQQNLKKSLLDQLISIDQSLQVYGSRCDEKLMALYDHLIKMSAVMTESVQTACAGVQ